MPKETEEKRIMPMETVNGNIFHFVYLLAMRDATIQRAFECSNKKELCKNQEIIKEITGDLKKYINQIFQDKDTYAESSAKVHDENFYDCAKNIKERVNGYSSLEKKNDTEFTFGNAQKLINMTVKYLYIANYENESRREHFKYCHCPMDGYMMKSVLRFIVNEYSDKESLIQNLKDSSDKRSFNVFDDREIENFEDHFDDYLTKANGELCKKNWKRISWSRIDSDLSSDDKYGPYEFFQTMVKIAANIKRCYPIELDYVLWNADI